MALSPEEIVAAVRAAGVVGGGGAGFPTEVKLKTKAKWVIANAAQCEPLIACDEHTLERDAALVIEGLNLAMVAVGASKGVVAIKRKHEEKLGALREAIKAFKGITIKLLDDFYPAGDEHVLVYDVTGMAVPAGGIPPQAGVVVLNVETLRNIALAAKGIPVTHRTVTVAGAVKKPKTFRAPVGTPLSDLIKACGGATVAEFGILDGGPMMGRLVDSAESVTKTTSGVIVLPASHEQILRRTRSLSASILRGKSVCCQCSFCTDLCPRNLLGHALRPHMAVRIMSYALENFEGEVTSATLCCECGLCEAYACTMQISPMRLFREVKAQLAKAGWKPSGPRPVPQPKPIREFRRVPVNRLVTRLGLSDYEAPAPFEEQEVVPSSLDLPLKQQAGAAAEPVVAKGARVKKGDLVAKAPEGKLGAPVHTAVAGTVSEVSPERIRIEPMFD